MQSTGAGGFSHAADGFPVNFPSVDASKISAAINPHQHPPLPHFPNRHDLTQLPPPIPPTLSKTLRLLLVAPDIICFVPVTISLKSKTLRLWSLDGKEQEIYWPSNQKYQEFY